MSRFLWALATSLGLILVQAGGAIGAGNEGQEDLDKATEAKLSARTLADLDEVIRLAESSLQKGLDEGNAQFARSLLVSTLVQRGAVRTEIILRSPPTDPKLAEFRKATLEGLEKAIKLDVRQPQAWLRISQLSRLPGGDPKRADEALEQAIRQGGDDPETQAKALVLRAALTEGVEKKTADLDEAVRIAPREPAAWRARGLVRADLGKLEEALADLNKALELDPKHAPTFEVKAIILGRLRKYDEALVALDQARQLNPESAFPLMQKARIHAMQANPKAAMHELNEAHKLDPKNVAVLLLRAALEEDADKRLADLDEAVRLAPHSALALRTRGLFYAEQGKNELALLDLDKAIAADPKDFPNYEAKAAVLGKLKRYDEAVATIEKLREQNPKSAYLRVQKARLRIQQSDLKAALAELDEAHALEPDNLGVLLLRAGVHQELGERAKALADADQILRLDPQSIPAMRLRAVLLADANKLDEAAAQLEKARQADPKDAIVLLQLASVYSSQHKIDKALELYSAVLAEDPEQWMALRGRGDALLNAGKHAAAIADYEKALKLRPKDVGILNNFAWVLATSPEEKLRDGKRAIALATQACEATQYQAPHILSTLGAACAETGDFETAMKYSKKAMELAKGEQKENLEKEQEAYRANKPFRELLRDGKPVPQQPEKKAPPNP